MKADNEGKVGDVISLRSSQGNHTPGPWWADGKIVRTLNEDQPRRAPIAQCAMSHGIGDAGLADEANARLIAAAPELLKLVSDHIQIFALQALRDSADPKTLEGWRVLQAAAAAVLAKAKP